MSFAAIRSKKSNLQALQQKVQENANGNGGGTKDPRCFKHTFDKTTKIGSTLIRFLPRYDENGEIMVPWVAWTEYSFKNAKNVNYWNRSLMSVGDEDPVSQLNKAHWARIPEAQKAKGVEAGQARQRNVKKKYCANIVVLSDDANPANNGKVFFFEFGAAIQQILEKAWFPKHKDQKPLEFFDWMEGASFRIRSDIGKNGWMSYDDSSFEGISALAEGRVEVQEAIYNAMHPLTEYEADDKYKPYETLKSEMIKVLGRAYVADIMGDEWIGDSVQSQVSTGGNPFNPQQAQAGGGQAQQQQAPVQQQAQADPFAQQAGDGQAPVQQAQQQAPVQQQADPFAQPAQQQAPVQQQADPFAQQQQQAPAQQPAQQQQKQDDPFAQPAQQQQAPAQQQQQADPFDQPAQQQSGEGQADPFAKKAQTATTGDDGQADPFANLSM